jgi:hypothetical protein
MSAITKPVVLPSPASVLTKWQETEGGGDKTKGHGAAKGRRKSVAALKQIRRLSNHVYMAKLFSTFLSKVV